LTYVAQFQKSKTPENHSSFTSIPAKSEFNFCTRTFDFLRSMQRESIKGGRKKERKKRAITKRNDCHEFHE